MNGSWQNRVLICSSKFVSVRRVWYNISLCIGCTQMKSRQAKAGLGQAQAQDCLPADAQLDSPIDLHILLIIFILCK